MSDIANTTRAQTLFLRAFRTNPAGPPADAWPSPAILRKWLRRPAFRTALASVQAALRFRADFHLAAAADHAAQRLTAAALDPAANDAAELRKLAEILRLAHLRQRFPGTGDPADLESPATFARRDEIRQLETEIEDLQEQAQLDEEEEDEDQDENDPDAALRATDLHLARQRLAELRDLTRRRSR